MANKRLIDANALYWRAEKEKMEELFPNWKELPQEVKDMLCKHGKEFERLLKEAPTVDAVEVVHGKWEGSAYDIRGDYEEQCSHCKQWSTAYGSDFCPNCGAKMDGGNEDG